MPPKDTRTGLCECGCGESTRVVHGVPSRFIAGHNRNASAGKSRSGRKVDWSNYTIEDRGYETPCHIWQGPTNGLGYGRVGAGKYGERKQVHVAVYERNHGPVPKGFDVHHKCRVQLCCNDEHLEALTEVDHNEIHHLGTKRTLSTECRRGHPFTPENIYLGSNGYRYCRTCRAEYVRKR